MVNVLASNTSSTISNYVSTNYASKFSLGSAIICGGAAIEMALNIFKDINDKAHKRPNAMKNLSANLGGAIFYGLCAANVISGTAIVGAAIFTIYSLVKCNDADTYLSSRLIGKSIRYIYTEIFSPVVHKIAKIVGDILKPIFNGIYSVLKQIHLPEHPIWYGVFLLGGAILAYKFAIPVLFKAVL